jgi:hypothetical protein
VSTWTAPITWVNGAVTAATMNAEIRDHANFLKGSLDLITASTTADTGVTTYIDIRRTTNTDPAFRSGVSGAANPELQIDRNGRHQWGPGGASALDLFLERSSGTVLRLTGTLDPQFRVQLGGVPAPEANVFQGTVSGDTLGRVRMSIRTDGFGSFAISNGTTDYAKFYVDTAGNAYVGSVNVPTWLVGANGINFSDAFAGTARISIDNYGSTTTRMYFAGDVASALSRTATGRLAAAGRLAAVDGLATKVKAGTIGDGDFTATAESGLFAVDTTDDRFYVRSGSTWRYIDMIGSTTEVGPFTYTNLAASGTAVLADLPSAIAAARIKLPWGGSIVGMSVRGSANTTAGTAAFKPDISGSAGTLTITLPTDDAIAFAKSQAAGVDTFTTGNTIGVQVTTNGAFTPVTTEFAVWLYVVWARS